MLAKQVQTQLAQANSVADEALASMTTVRAHAADDSARAAYAVKLAKFYSLQVSLVKTLYLVMRKPMMSPVTHYVSAAMLMLCTSGGARQTHTCFTHVHSSQYTV